MCDMIMSIMKLNEYFGFLLFISDKLDLIKPAAV